MKRPIPKFQPVGYAVAEVAVLPLMTCLSAQRAYAGDNFVELWGADGSGNARPFVFILWEFVGPRNCGALASEVCLPENVSHAAAEVGREADVVQGSAALA